MIDHPDKDVREAIIKLADALCMWERATSRQSVLIVREQGGFVFRAVNGKPGVPEGIVDAQLVENLIDVL